VNLGVNVRLSIFRISDTSQMEYSVTVENVEQCDNSQDKNINVCVCFCVCVCVWGGGVGVAQASELLSHLWSNKQ